MDHSFSHFRSWWTTWHLCWNILRNLFGSGFLLKLALNRLNCRQIYNCRMWQVSDKIFLQKFTNKFILLDTSIRLIYMSNSDVLDQMSPCKVGGWSRTTTTALKELMSVINGLSKCEVFYKNDTETGHGINPFLCMLLKTYSQWK